MSTQYNMRAKAAKLFTTRPIGQIKKIHKDKRCSAETVLKLYL